MNNFFMNILIIFVTLSNLQLFVESLQTAELIVRYGYPVEIHQILTKDNYVVGLERIPHGKNSNKTIGKAIILLPGIFGTSIQFSLVNDSLSYMLADAGFDVWMLNYRLTGISKNLINPTTGNITSLTNASWNFEFEDLALNDMISSIDYVLEKTGYNKVDLGAYSLGGTLTLVGLSERPEYNEKIDRLLLMAPASRLKNIDAKFRPLFKILFTLTRVNILTYIPKLRNPDNQTIVEFCHSGYLKKICLAFYYYIEGAKSPTVKEAPNILKVFPQPTSMKLIEHFLQLGFKDKFSKFDYGQHENRKRYNSSSPPLYNLTKVIVPTIIVHSKYDTISAPQDIQWLEKQLPNVIDVHFIKDVIFTHQSYTLSPYAKDVNSYAVNMLLKNNV